MASVDLMGTGSAAAVVPAPPASASRNRHGPARRASLIVPTLNEAKRLAPLLERLDAPLRRRHDLEIIISDGGSADGTLDVARSLADHVVVHRGPERQTIAAGRNAGARHAAGRLLLFCNADVDFPDDIDDFLRTVLRAAERHGAATCRVEVHPDVATLQDRLVLGGCNAAYWAWNQLGLGMGRGECQAVRREVFRAVGGYNPALVAGEDFDLYRRVARFGRRTGQVRVVFLWDQILWEDPRRYRKHGYARTLASWLRNSLYVTLFGRAHSHVWEPVR